MFSGSMSSSSIAPGGLWDALRKEARKLEGEVDSKLAAYSKLGARGALQHAGLELRSCAGGDKPAVLLSDATDQARATVLLRMPGV
jgi:hypothetical protein